MSDVTNSREALIQGYLEGTLTEAECGRFRSLLRSEPETIRLVLDNLRMDALLREVVGKNGLTIASAIGSAGTTRELPVDEVLAPPRSRLADPPRKSPAPGSRGLPDGRFLRSGPLRRLIRERRNVLVLAASVAMAMGLSLWLFPSTHNEPTLSLPSGTQVALERGGQSLPGQDGLKLLPGDLLHISGSNGAAIAYGKENTRVVLNDQTELKILSWSKGKRLELRQGKVQATAARQRLWSPMILVTEQAEARVLGTQFSLAATTNVTRLDVTEGKVRFTRRSDEVVVKVAAGNYAVATANSELAALPFTGHIRREWWNGVSLPTVEVLRADPRYPGHPDGAELVPALELKSVSTNQMGMRFCGYVHPPVTGDYEFWLVGGPAAALFMSPDENPDEQVRLAYNEDTNPHSEQPRLRGASSWAPPVPLVAGRRYYVEALLFINNGEGQLSVAWKIPGREREPLTREYLSPFKPK